MVLHGKWSPLLAIWLKVGQKEILFLLCKLKIQRARPMNFIMGLPHVVFLSAKSNLLCKRKLQKAQNSPCHLIHQEIHQMPIHRPLIKQHQILQIKQLKANCFIGVWEHEQHKRQPLIFDFIVEYQDKNAANSDQLEDTLNYSHFAREAKEFAESRRFHLLESLSQKLAQFLFEKYSIKRLELTIHKPCALKNLANVSLSVCYTA